MNFCTISSKDCIDSWECSLKPLVRLEILMRKKKTKKREMKVNLNRMRTAGKLHLMHHRNHTNVQYVPDLLYRKLACKITCGRICPEREDLMESLFYNLNTFTLRMVCFIRTVITIRPATSSVQSAVKRFLRREIWKCI